MTCESEFVGYRCQLPADHGGMHAYSGPARDDATEHRNERGGMFIEEFASPKQLTDGSWVALDSGTIDLGWSGA